MSKNELSSFELTVHDSLVHLLQRLEGMPKASRKKIYERWCMLKLMDENLNIKLPSLIK